MSNPIRLPESLVNKASITCANAFIDDPETIYLIPDKKKRENLKYAFVYYLRMSVAERAEICTTSPNCEGVAIWTESEGKTPWWTIFSINPFPPLRCGWRYILHEMTFYRFAHKVKKQFAPFPHKYLALLAVDPSQQGKGFASQLLKPMLEKLDKQHLPTYLETQNLKNVNMYRHFGFELVYENTLPHTTLPMYVMVRK
jgi:GNAT superfamily N-acetyltransferase